MKISPFCWSNDFQHEQLLQRMTKWSAGLFSSLLPRPLTDWSSFRHPFTCCHTEILKLPPFYPQTAGEKKCRELEWNRRRIYRNGSSFRFFFFFFFIFFNLFSLFFSLAFNWNLLSPVDRCRVIPHTRPAAIRLVSFSSFHSPSPHPLVCFRNLIDFFFKKLWEPFINQSHNESKDNPDVHWKSTTFTWWRMLL